MATTPTAPAAGAPTVAEESRDIGMVNRALNLRAETWNPENRTVEVVFTTGARRTMFDFERWRYVEEELSTEPGAVRLERINAGGPVLDSHRRYELENQIGVVVPGSARIEGGQGIATLQLSAREDVAGIVQDIRDGIIRNISVGYRVYQYEVTEKEGERAIYRAVDWEPAEISFVPIPADAGAQARSENPGQGGTPCIIRRNGAAPKKETTMTNPNPGTGAPQPEIRAAEPAAPAAPAPAPAPAVERQPATLIRSAVVSAGLPHAFADELIGRSDNEGLSLTALRAAIGERIIEANRATPAPVNRVSISVDEGDTRREAMADMLLSRMNPRHQAADAARELYRGRSMLRMAEELLETRGQSLRGLSPHEIAERALHSTSDFPNILANVMNKRLRAAYNENEPTYRRWARRGANFPDFRNMGVTQLSEMPDLVAVAEGGELQYGAVSDGHISYRMLTYGRIIGVTRQTLINDDLRALERWATGYAGSATRLENRVVYGILTGANTYGGQNLFQAGLGNLAGAGAAISIATLGAGRARMRLQRGLQNNELNIAPAYLLAPATQEQLAYQFTSSQFVPATSGSVNEFRAGGRTALEPIIDPVLDAVSTTAWYLVADSSQVDTIEYAYLDGNEGLNLSTRVGFNIDGFEFKALLDFGAAAIDHRGLDRNPGA
jgi:hypothetical protein